MSAETQLIAKWRRWLDRIEEDQLRDLLINRRIFHQFRDCIEPYVDGDRGAELANWMARNYVASAVTSIRRMVESPGRKWKSISLIILLEEMAKNDSLLSRERFSRLYQSSSVKQFVNRDFAKIAGNKNDTLVRAAKINRDIRALKSACQRIKKLVDKVVGHTEEDRRKVPRVRFGEIDRAIDLLETTFKRYYILLKGTCPDPLVPWDDFEVMEDLNQIWQ